MAIFLGYFPFLGQHRAEAMCLLPSRILHRSEWLRMIVSTSMHVDDMHLYFNMISLLWKGRCLESWLGSNRSLLLSAVFAVAASSTIVGLSYLADKVFSFNGGGVLFALKVLHTTYFPYSDHNLFGWLPNITACLMNAQRLFSGGMSISLYTELNDKLINEYLIQKKKSGHW
uniref:Peptidase S54 rhomboid domain-containing protein n=1 Tax=Wuchereria bancrofti TaxID=6293 RepID=A0AAF5RXF5_WUCBA